MISIYVKHLWKTTKNKPIQPIIIILSAALSVAIFVSALFLQSIYLQNIEIERTAMFNNADIRITVSSQSGEKYFEYSDITKNIGENDIAECYFSYFETYKNANANELMVAVLGVDFAHINRINKINFIESEKINNQNQNDIVIVSKSFAKENNLHINDLISLSILGTEQRFVVVGIAQNEGYFITHDIILSINNFMRILMAKTPIPIMSSNVKYFNTAIIKLADNSTKNSTISQLKNSEIFVDKQVEDTLEINKYKVDSNTRINKLFIYVIILCCSIVSIILMYTTYEIFMGHRLHSAVLFKSIGASENQMIFLLLSEVFFYSFIGSLFGLYIGSLLLKLVLKIVDIPVINIIFPLKIYFYAFFYGIILALVCVFIPIKATSKKQIGEMLSGETKRYNKPKIQIVLCLIISLILEIMIIFFLPNRYRIWCALAIFLTVVATTIFSMPYVTAFFSKLFETQYKKTNKNNFIILAAKNSKRNLSIQNANRIFCITTIIVIVLFNSINFIKETSLEQAKETKFDYYATTLLFPSDFLYDDIQKIDGVESVYKVCLNEKACLKNNIAYPLVGYKGRLEDIFRSTTYEGNVEKLNIGEVAITKSIAQVDNYEIGDEIEVCCNNIKQFLKIVAILETNSFYIITPVENFNLQYTDLIINESKDIYEELTIVMNEKVAIISKRENVVQYALNEINQFIILAEIFILLIASITFIGISNSVFISLRARKDEFIILNQLGMKNSKRALMVIMEFLINLIGISLIIFLSVCLINFSMMEAFKFFGINYNRIFFIK